MINNNYPLKANSVLLCFIEKAEALEKEITKKQKAQRDDISHQDGGQTKRARI